MRARGFAAAVCLAALVASPWRRAAAAPLWEVAVEAGSEARDHAVVTFPLGPDYVGKSFVLRDGRGAMLPVQVDGTGRGVFILPSLKAGSSALYYLEERQAARGAGVVSVIDDKDLVRVQVNRRPVLVYRKTSATPRAGVLHPVYSPSGVVVTGEGGGPGRGRDGIWSGVARIEVRPRKLDYSDPADKAAMTQIESVGPVWAGPVTGGFRARHISVDAGDPTGPTLLREEWEVRAYATHAGATPYFLFDVDVTFWTGSPKDVLVEKSLQTGMGVRGRAEWTGKKMALAASGGREGLAADLAVAKWFYLGAQGVGRAAGIGAHYFPENPGPPHLAIAPESPTAWWAIARLKPIAIIQKTPYHLRARFVVADGPLNRQLQQRISDDYQHPVKVTINSVGGPAPKPDAGAPPGDGGPARPPPDARRLQPKR